MPAPKPPAAKVKQVTAGEVVAAALEILQHEVTTLYFESEDAFTDAFPNGLQIVPYKLLSKLEGLALREIEKATQEGYPTDRAHSVMVAGFVETTSYQAWREALIADIVAGRYTFNKVAQSRAKIYRHSGARA